MARDVALPVGEPGSFDTHDAPSSLPGSSNQRLPVTKSSSSSSSNSMSSGDFALEDFWAKSSRPPPLYHDVDGQRALSAPDVQRQERNNYHWLRTLVRGRSFPLVPILVSMVWSALAVYISYVAQRYTRFNKTDCRWFCSPLALDSTTHSYVGFALFLLLGFRVNESYARYMEGMKIWTNVAGTITSTAKYFVQAFKPDFCHKGDRERLLGWLVAFPVALKRELRGERDLRELKSVLAPEDLAELQNAPNMPSHALYVLSAYIIEARKYERAFPQTFLVHLIRWIADLASAADMCMQIKRTPCAFSYVAHLRTFLALWLFLLPFTLVESTSWGTPLVVGFITYGIVGVEFNAAELENPFGKDYNDLPLGKMVEGIQDDVRATYMAAKAGTRKYVHVVGPVKPEEGEQFWLDSTKED